MFGGYLPVERTTVSSSLKHQGNLVHKEKKMRYLKKGIDRYRIKTEIRGQV